MRDDGSHGRGSVPPTRGPLPRPSTHARAPPEPRDVEHLSAIALAGGVGFAGNWAAAIIRSRAGHRLDSPALVADGAHARADAYVSLAVVASAAAVALGVQVADPLIGLAISGLILQITWRSWCTVRPKH